MYVVICPYNSKFAIIDQRPDMRIGRDPLYLLVGIHADSDIEAVGFTHIGGYILPDDVEQFGNFAVFRSGGNCAGHTSARFMPQNDYGFYAQMFHCVIDATHYHGIVHTVAGGTDDKDIADTLVENQFYRNPRIGAADNGNERILFRGGFLYPFVVVVRKQAMVVYVPQVAFLQKFQCCFGCFYYRTFGFDFVLGLGSGVFHDAVPDEKECA